MTRPVIDATPYLERKRAAEARWPVPDRGPYPHSSECRRPKEPAWELVDMDAGTWRRQCMEISCQVPQYEHPKVPPRPPEPDGEQLAAWRHSFDGKPCPNVEPVIFTEWEPDERARDGRGCWKTTCRVCKSVKRWMGEANDHYAGHGVEPDRPTSFRIDELGTGDHRGPIYVHPPGR